MGNKAEETEAVAVRADEQSASFHADDLLRAWDAFADSLSEKIYLKNTMLNNKPVLKQSPFFEVTVHNPGQENELTAHAADILTSLRTQLQNTTIQMQIRIDEANEKKRAYTAVEKYEYLREVNPALDKLREEFNLKLD